MGEYTPLKLHNTMNDTPLPLKRPTSRDPRVVTEIANTLAPKIIDWLGDDADGITLEDVIKDLQAAMRYTDDDDGYSLAHQLEDTGSYDPDAQLVEILDNAGFARHNAYERVCTTWIAETNQVGPAIGTQVTWPANSRAGWGR